MSYEVNYENAAGVVLMTIPALVITGRHINDPGVSYGLTILGGLVYVFGMGLLLLRKEDE